MRRIACLLLSAFMPVSSVYCQQATPKGSKVPINTSAGLVPNPAQAAQGGDSSFVAKTRKQAERGDAKAQYLLGSMYDIGKGLPQDYTQAVVWYRKAANQGNADAQSMLGSIYLAGVGVPQDTAQGIALLRKAAEQGLAMAQFGLGVLYDNGESAPRDYPRAAVWYRKAAKQGIAEAQYRLGTMHYYGQGVPKNAARAAVWYRKAAEQGNADAQFALGLLYLNGQGMPLDTAQAAFWWRKAADQGNANAAASLGQAYYKGQGMPKDYTQAAVWWRKAAEQGDADAQFNLGSMYDNGQGVPRDYARAVVWYRKAAEQGNAPAQYNLGQSYVKGNGVPKDTTKAMEWWRKAADQGNAAAQYNIGQAYASGDGVPKDYTQAAFWWRKAAEQGEADAQYNLGVTYYNGQGVPQNYSEAYFWMDIAATGNSETIKQEDLAKIRDQIASRLTAADLSRVQERARKWFEKHSAGENQAMAGLPPGATVEPTQQAAPDNSQSLVGLPPGATVTPIPAGFVPDGSVPQTQNSGALPPLPPGYRLDIPAPAVLGCESNGTCTPATMERGLRLYRSTYTDAIMNHSASPDEAAKKAEDARELCEGFSAMNVEMASGESQPDANPVEPGSGIEDRRANYIYGQTLTEEACTPGANGDAVAKDADRAGATYRTANRAAWAKLQSAQPATVSVPIIATTPNPDNTKKVQMIAQLEKKVHHPCTDAYYIANFNSAYPRTSHGAGKKCWYAAGSSATQAQKTALGSLISKYITEHPEPTWGQIIMDALTSAAPYSPRNTQAGGVTKIVPRANGGYSIYGPAVAQYGTTTVTPRPGGGYSAYTSNSDGSYSTTTLTPQMGGGYTTRTVDGHGNQNFGTITVQPGIRTVPATTVRPQRVPAPSFHAPQPAVPQYQRHMLGTDGKALGQPF